jgi:uncharacterized protein (DUF2461 family)
MQAALPPETFRFLRQLARNNRKAWMDANRERYQEHVMAPLRGLLAALGPSLLELDPGFDVGPRAGRTLSRINRDVRFASDKSSIARARPAVQPRRCGRLGRPALHRRGPTISVGFRITGG